MDEADKSEKEYSEHCEHSIAAARRAAAKIPAGEPGICDVCDTDSARLVKVEYRGHPAKACAFCRDDLKLG